MESNTKLEAARRLRGWSLEVASQKIGVHPRTLRRWETGRSRPHGFRIYKISEVYETTPSALGIGSERHQWYIPQQKKPRYTEDLLRARVVEPLITVEDLDLHLMGLILQRKLDRQNLDYQSFQLQVHQCIQAYDQKLLAHQASPLTDPVRVQALRVVASIPVAAYLENVSPHSRLTAPTEILTHCASAITACWHMNLQSEQTLARTLVSGYIILLSEIFARGAHYRQPAAELIAQACLLRTTLAMLLDGTQASVSYYTRALEFSQFADKASTQLPMPTPPPSGYGRQPAQTLRKMAESLWLLKPAPPPPDFPLVRDYLHKMLAFYHIPYPDAFEETGQMLNQLAAVFHFPQTVDYATAALHLWHGLTHHELGEYAHILDNSGISNRETPISDAPKLVREEFLQNRALASLRLHDMDQTITTLRAAIPQALRMGGEQELVEARSAYHIMQFLTPGEATAPTQELKDLLKTHD